MTQMKEAFLKRWMAKKKKANTWTEADKRLMVRNGCEHLLTKAGRRRAAR